MTTGPEYSKRKNRVSPRAIVNLWGCTLSLIMLGAGVTLGLMGAIFAAPVLLQLDVTQTVQAELQTQQANREMNLAATAADLEQRERAIPVQMTDDALVLQATEAVLLNRARLLAQTSTQSARFIAATATSDAARSAQERTQVALDQAATESDLQQQATDAQIDFRNTQAALGISTQAAQAQFSLSTATPSPTMTSMPTATLAPLQLNFAAGFPSDWVLSSADDWQSTTDSIRATQADAWGLTRSSYAAPYQLEISLQPSLNSQSTYIALLAVGDDSGLALRITATGLEANSAALYEFPVDLLTAGSLQPAQMQQIEREFINVLLIGDTRLHITMADNRVSAQLNDSDILTARLNTDTSGAVGFYASEGVELRRLNVNDTGEEQ